MDALRTAVESLFQISVPSAELVDADGWQSLTQAISPFEVDFANGVRVAGPNGVLQTIVQAGGAEIDASDVAGILEARTPSESELARLVRHEEFWRSLLADEHDHGARPATIPTTAVAQPGHPAGQPDFLGAAEIIPGLASGSVQVSTITTVRSGGDAEGERYEADPDELRVLAARAMPGVVSPAGDGWRVRIVNPTGDPDVLTTAAHDLLAAGASLVIASDSTRDAPAQTQVQYDRAKGPDAGNAIAGALGLGVVSATDDRIEGVDVTVTLGEDLAAAAPPTTEAPTTTEGATTSVTVRTASAGHR
jgi:hypothetical protein